MNEDIRKPEYLRWFPCMDPWVGPKYGCDERRLAVVAESHWSCPRFGGTAGSIRGGAARQQRGAGCGGGVGGVAGRGDGTDARRAAASQAGAGACGGARDQGTGRVPGGREYSA